MIKDVDHLKKELMTIEGLLDSCSSSEDSQRLNKEKRVLQMKLDALMKKRKSNDSNASAYYKEKMLERLKKQ
jgi:hypothetical protein